MDQHCVGLACPRSPQQEPATPIPAGNVVRYRKGSFCQEVSNLCLAIVSRRAFDANVVIERATRGAKLDDRCARWGRHRRARRNERRSGRHSRSLGRLGRACGDLCARGDLCGSWRCSRRASGIWRRSRSFREDCRGDGRRRRSCSLCARGNRSLCVRGNRSLCVRGSRSRKKDSHRCTRGNRGEGDGWFGFYCGDKCQGLHGSLNACLNSGLGVRRGYSVRD